MPESLEPEPTEEQWMQLLADATLSSNRPPEPVDILDQLNIAGAVGHGRDWQIPTVWTP